MDRFKNLLKGKAKKDTIQTREGKARDEMEGNSDSNQGRYSSDLYLKVAPIDEEDLASDDVIIAVMGPTGTGKSTFISAVVGYDTGIGHNLTSCTTDIQVFRISFPELVDANLVLIDTPGFDDAERSDARILEMISDCLNNLYKNNIYLSGLLYFHSITENRMPGTPLNNLKMFQKLCGKEALHKVILTTTMWDELPIQDELPPQEVGEKRERELKTRYWKEMLSYGSTVKRFLKTRQSAFQILEPLIDSANKRYWLLVQQEMGRFRLSLAATSAGQELYSRLEILIRKQQDTLSHLRREMTTNKDSGRVHELRERFNDESRIYDELLRDLHQYKLTLGNRLLKRLTSTLGITTVS